MCVVFIGSIVINYGNYRCIFDVWFDWFCGCNDIGCDCLWYGDFEYFEYCIGGV